jgi:hypothetical protein
LRLEGSVDPLAAHGADEALGVKGTPVCVDVFARDGFSARVAAWRVTLLPARGVNVPAIVLLVRSLDPLAAHRADEALRVQESPVDFDVVVRDRFSAHGADRGLGCGGTGGGEKRKTDEQGYDERLGHGSRARRHYP